MLVNALRIGIALCLFFSSAAVAIGPSWKSGPSVSDQTQRANPWLVNREITLQCPAVFIGVKDSLLPTGWSATDKGDPAVFVRSQLQGRDLFCVYRTSFLGRVGHVSVNRTVPAGYRCATDGAGSFTCSKAGP